MKPQRNLLPWAVRAVLALGVAASVTANILHARDNPISQAIAAWPPLALLVTVELVTRIPVYRKALGVVRILATIAIAGIAAWISYHHMVGVVARYGETGTVPYLLPLSVDGLIIVASICLVELSARHDKAPAPSEAVPAAAEPTVAPAAVVPATTSVPLPEAGIAARLSAIHGNGQPVPESPAQYPAETGSDQLDVDLQAGSAAVDQAPNSEPESAPGQDNDVGMDADKHDEHIGDVDGCDDEDLEIAADLVPLLPAARGARDELIGEGRAVSRDALAHRLRRNGHGIRNTRVSELLAALRREEPSHKGARPTVSARLGNPRLFDTAEKGG